MVPEQAQERLEAIRRLLAERERCAKAVEAIDQQIRELADVEMERRPLKRRPLSREDIRRLSGVL